MTTCPIPIFDTITEVNAQLKHPALLERNAEQRCLDYQQAYAFLQSYRGSEATYNVYRRDIERLLQWLWWEADISLKQLTRVEFEKFLNFCEHPPKSWVGDKQVSRFVQKNGRREHNPEWRPFTCKANTKQYELSQSALQGIFSVISSFFNFLIQENYVEQNPVAQIRQKSKYFRKNQSAKQIRRLSQLQWSYVIETAEQMAQADPCQHERTLFIMSALYAMYLRISELATSARWQPSMGHFNMDYDGNWWFTTVGKGNKERKIAVSKEMLQSLQRYRTHLTLSPLPTPGEATPLVMKLKGSGPVTSTRMIRAIVQKCFDKAIARLTVDGLTQDANALQAATVHWLRHTGISEDVKHRPREHVRDDAGHSSSAITDRYIDIELRERALSAKHKPLKEE